MANICDLNNQTPKIDYPTFWGYKVILDKNIDAKDAVEQIVKNRDHKVIFSKFSKDKTYASYDVNVLVFNDAERLEIFSALRKIAKYVL